MSYIKGVVAAVLGLTPCASAQDNPFYDDRPESNSVITLQVENDILFNTDEDYTNGLRLSYVHRPGDGPFGDQVSNFLRRISPVASRSLKSDLYYSLALGQNMFTPSDIETTELITDDRPYAGWLYLEFGVTAEDSHGYESMKLDLGVVGPASLAGKTQRWWHGVLGIAKPEGWDHQLPNEPGINLYYTRGYRLIESPVGDGLNMDLTPHWGVALGNVYTYGAGGLTFRLGTDLKRDSGAPPRIEPSLPGSDLFTGDGLDLYVFAGAEVRAVARDIFLDGTWAAHEHDVAKKNVIAEVQAGLVVFAGTLRFALTNTFRTAEYDGSSSHRYSAFTVSTRF